MQQLTKLAKLQGRAYNMFLYHILRNTDDFDLFLQFEYFICHHLVDFELLIFYLVVFKKVLITNSPNKSIKKIHLKLINYTIDMIGNNKFENRLLFHHFTSLMDVIFRHDICKDIRFHWNRHELYQISNPIRVENKSEKTVVDLFRFILLEKTLKDSDKEEKLKRGFYNDLEKVDWMAWLNLFHPSQNLHYVLLQGNTILTDVPNELLTILDYASGLPLKSIFPPPQCLIKLIKCSYANIRNHGYKIIKNMLFSMDNEALDVVFVCAIDICKWIHKLLELWQNPKMHIRTEAFQDLDEEDGEIAANVGLFYNESEYLDPSPILVDFFENIDMIFVVADLATKQQIWELLSNWVPPYNIKRSITHPHSLYGYKLIETVKAGITRILSLGDLWFELQSKN